RYPITNKFRDTGKSLPAPDEALVSRAAPQDEVGIWGSIANGRRECAPLKSPSAPVDWSG
ncbi:MAG: hypothetical protein ABIL01_10095, partial [Pseudomonadota bacterium]